MQLTTRARLAVRALCPQRNWMPIEVWDDNRYNHAFKRMKIQPDNVKAQCCAARDVDGPLFSFVVPLYETPSDYFIDMADSVLAQTYPRFELILVNASPNNEKLRELVNRYSQLDTRIKPVTLEDNFGITVNTNHGIEAACGDFVCFLDHDDWIEPDTLFEYVAALREHEDIDVMYCDEDMVEKRGGSWHHGHPMLKPDYSPELLFCKNYVVHLLAVRRSIIEKLPRPGQEYDGSQDYNLTLRASEIARRVHHVPRVLYHWRMSNRSIAINVDAKPYANQSSLLSIQRHLERLGLTGVAEETDIAHIYSVRFRPDRHVKVSLIITHAANAPTISLAALLKSLEQARNYGNVEIVFVGSSGTSAEPEARGDNIEFVSAPIDASISERFNIGASNATGDVLVFLDERCSFTTPEPLEQTLGLLGRKGVGIVAPKILYANHTVKHYGIGVSSMGISPLHRGLPLDYYGYLCNLATFQNASAVGYQGLTIRKALFNAVGGFNTSYAGELYSVSLCKKVIERGERVALTPTVIILTSEAAPERPYDESTERIDFPANEVVRFLAENPDVPIIDPYKNRHLDQTSSYSTLDPLFIS